MLLPCLRATSAGASIPTAPYAKGNLKIDWTGEDSPRQFRFASAQLQMTHQVKTMWQKNCPVCRKRLEKKSPTDTIDCPSSKYVWKS